MYLQCSDNKAAINVETLGNDDHVGGEYFSTIEVKINVGEQQHALDLPWARKNSVSPTSELYFPNRITTWGEQRGLAVGVDADEVLQADGHLAYADAKVFYQGFLPGSKRQTSGSN